MVTVRVKAEVQKCPAQFMNTSRLFPTSGHTLQNKTAVEMIRLIVTPS